MPAVCEASEAGLRFSDAHESIACRVASAAQTLGGPPAGVDDRSGRLRRCARIGVDPGRPHRLARRWLA